MKANNLPDFMQVKFLINYRSIIEISIFSITNKIRRYLYKMKANNLLDFMQVNFLINYRSKANDGPDVMRLKSLINYRLIIDY